MQSIFENQELEEFLEGDYVSIREGQKRCLQFFPDKTQIVDKEYQGTLTKKVRFICIDLNQSDRREKYFDLARKHATKMWNEHLKKGNTVLEVLRIGQGQQTQYICTPIIHETSTNRK
jgi:hypothetical protein